MIISVFRAPGHGKLCIFGDFLKIKKHVFQTHWVLRVKGIITVPHKQFEKFQEG